MTDPGQPGQCRAQGSASAEKMPKIQGPILFGLHTECGKGKKQKAGLAGRYNYLGTVQRGLVHSENNRDHNDRPPHAMADESGMDELARVDVAPFQVRGRDCTPAA